MRRHGWAREIDLPDTDAVAEALLIALSHFSRLVEPREIYDLLADKFGLTLAQRNAPRHTREESAWHNRVQTARKRLVERGELNGQMQGLWSLTAAGRERAKLLEKLSGPDGLIFEF
jgi:hypothetical protein